MVNAWGFGAARKVPSSTKEATERVAFVPDIHVPYQDPALVASSLALIKHLKPHRLVLLGDLFDFHTISRWNTSLERLDSLQEEIDQGVGLLREYRKAAPNAAMHFVMGNHEERLRRYIREKGPAVRSLRALDFKEQIQAKAVACDVHEGHGFLLRPNFLVRHGTMIRKGAGTTAKAEAAAAGVNGISGHTHRLGTYRLTGYNSLQWTEAGTLSRVDPPYVAGVPDHQQGMAVGYFSTRKGGSFIVEEVQAAKGGFLWYGGRTF
jgi:predicted phosphodiesterase